MVKGKYYMEICGRGGVAHEYVQKKLLLFSENKALLF